MSSPKTHDIIFSRKGQTARTVYSPDTAKTMEELGEVTTQRASHVEPGSMMSRTALNWLDQHHRADQGEWEGANTPKSTYTESDQQMSGCVLKTSYANKWFADCLPVGGPVLGPFDDRDTALKAEADWLRENNIPLCEPCREAETDHSTPTEPIPEGDIDAPHFTAPTELKDEHRARSETP